MLTTLRVVRAPLRALLLGIAALFAVPAAAHAAACPGADQLPTAATLTQARRATLCLVNVQRRSHGLSQLRTNATLQRSAESYSRQMVRQSFFDHVSPSGVTFDERIHKLTSYLAHTLRWEVGENIAWGSGSLATPANIVNAWMHSAEHRHNILHASYREMGMGIAIGAPVRLSAAARAATYTNQFGRRG